MPSGNLVKVSRRREILGKKKALTVKTKPASLTVKADEDDKSKQKKSEVSYKKTYRTTRWVKNVLRTILSRYFFIK